MTGCQYGTVRKGDLTKHMLSHEGATRYQCTVLGCDYKRKYFRILKSIDATEETKRIQNVLKEVFQNLAMKVIVETEPVYDSEVAVLFEELRKLPNLHFEK